MSSSWMQRAGDFFGALKAKTENTALVALLHQHDRVTKVVPIAEAHVPCIKLTVDGVDIDLTFANVLDNPCRLCSLPSGAATPEMRLPQQLQDEVWNADPGAIIDDNIMMTLQHDRQALRSVNGVLATHAILDAVSSAPHMFRGVALQVKQWAKARGIYGSAYGFLGGISWSLLVAKVCSEHPELPQSSLLRLFFQTWAKWQWSQPVELVQRTVKGGEFTFTLDAEVWDARKSSAPMVILTPVYPSMNTSHSVSRTALRVLVAEFHRGAELYRCNPQALDCDNDGEQISMFSTLGKDVMEEFHQKYPCCLLLNVLAASSSQQGRWVELLHASLRHLVRNLATSSLVSDAQLLPRNIRSRNASRHEMKHLHSQFLVGLGVTTVDSPAEISAFVSSTCATFTEQMRQRAISEGWDEPNMSLTWQLQNNLMITTETVDTSATGSVCETAGGGTSVQAGSTGIGGRRGNGAKRGESQNPKRGSPASKAGADHEANAGQPLAPPRAETLVDGDGGGDGAGVGWPALPVKEVVPASPKRSTRWTVK
jgi:hypothetical protein